MSVKTGLTSRCYHTVNGQDSIQLIPGVEHFLPPASTKLTLVLHCLQSARLFLIRGAWTDLTENQSEPACINTVVYLYVVISQSVQWSPGDKDISGGEGLWWNI